MVTDDDPIHPLCNSQDLVEGGRAVSFDVNYAGQTCRAFAVRFEGQAHAYLNRCSHVAMEMDWQAGRTRYPKLHNTYQVLANTSATPEFTT